MRILGSLVWTNTAHLLPLAQLPSSVCNRARQGRSPDSISAEDHDEYLLVVPLSGHLLIAGAFCLLAEPKALVVSLCARLVDRAVIEAEVGGFEGFRIPAVVFDGICLSRRKRRRNGERRRSDWKCHGALT